MTDHDAQMRPIRQAKAVQAASMTPEQRFLATFELFEVVRQRMLAGIRAENPQKTEAEVEAEFRWRLQAQRDREDRSIYQLVEAAEES